MFNAAANCAMALMGAGVTILGAVYGDSNTLKILVGVIVCVVGLGGLKGVVSWICGTSLGSATA